MLRSPGGSALLVYRGCWYGQGGQTQEVGNKAASRSLARPVRGPAAVSPPVRAAWVLSGSSRRRVLEEHGRRRLDDCQGAIRRRRRVPGCCLSCVSGGNRLDPCSAFSPARQHPPDGQQG